MNFDYIFFLDFIGKLNELNEKLNEFTASYMDNAIVGAAVVVGILVVACAGVNALNK